jgi:hypothetical protein
VDHWYDLLGTPCCITCTDPATSARLELLLAPFEDGVADTDAALHATIEPTGPASDLVLRFRGERHEGTRSPVLARLISQLTAAAIDGFAGFAVHAGVVARDECAVVMAAASGVGKSTLTAACLQRGFDYLSDEALCIEPGRRDAVPFAKPLALGVESARLLGLGRERLDTKDLVPASFLGARIAGGPVPIGHVVSLVRTGDGRSAPIEVDRSTAVSTLLGMSFNAHRNQEQAMATAAAVARGARSWQLDVDDPHRAAAVLYELAGEPAP